MKKFLMTALIAATIFSSSFAADVNKVNYKAQQNFEAVFGNASNLSWTVNSTYTKASFEMDGERMEAFYDAAGEPIGISRNITTEQLPVMAKRVLAKKYNGYTVKAIIRFEDAESTSYYISAENENEQVVLKYNNSSLTTFKKTSK